MSILETIKTPADLRALPVDRLGEVAAEIRAAIIDQVSHRRAPGAQPRRRRADHRAALRLRLQARPPAVRRGAPVLPAQAADRRLPLLAKLRTREGMGGFPSRSRASMTCSGWGTRGRGFRRPSAWRAATR
ncbi:MAG: hypothetical protein R3B49_06545 [Phycisphaerales bacterium]